MSLLYRQWQYCTGNVSFVQTMKVGVTGFGILLYWVWQSVYWPWKATTVGCTGYGSVVLYTMKYCTGHEKSCRYWQWGCCPGHGRALMAIVDYCTGHVSVVLAMAECCTERDSDILPIQYTCYDNLLYWPWQCCTWDLQKALLAMTESYIGHGRVVYKNVVLRMTKSYTQHYRVLYWQFLGVVLVISGCCTGNFRVLYWVSHWQVHSVLLAIVEYCNGCDRE